MLVRTSRVRILDHRDATTIIGADGAVRRLEGDTAELARVILTYLSIPRARAELFEHLEVLSGGPLEHAAVVDDLLRLLADAGVIQEARMPAEAPASQLGGRIVLGVTGAVAAVDAPLLVRELQQRGHQVQVALTQAAQRFVAVDGLAALTHAPVHTGLFERSRVAPHIQLAEWADAVVVCPATATTISRLAGGDCSDLVAAVAVATCAPVVVVPSMNPGMFEAPAVQRNLETLRDDGFFIVHPHRATEVAHRPKERQPVLGGAPGARTVADLVGLVMTTHARVTDWEAVYRSTSSDRLPWFEEALDAEIAQILEVLPDRGALLDVGTGLGSTAIGAARLGFRVVATDVSRIALSNARARAPDLPITWLCDDVTDSKLEASFDVVVDRACLHTLPSSRITAYVEAMVRLTRAGSLLLLESYTGGSALPGTRAFEAEEIERMFAPHFEVVSTTRALLGDSPALISVLRRLGRPS